MQKTRSNTFILENEKVWEPAGEGVVRQIMGYDGQVMLVKVKFEQGAVGTPIITRRQHMLPAASLNLPSTAKNKSFQRETAFIWNRMQYTDVSVWKQGY